MAVQAKTQAEKGRGSGRKGSFGYIAREKKKRFLIAALMLAIPLIIFFSAKAYIGTTRNVFSVVAILGVLPAAKFIVNFIMMMMQKSAPEDIIDLTEKHVGTLPHAYELIVTAYEGSMPLDAVTVCGNQVIAFSTYGNRDQFEMMEKHIAKILTGNGYSSVNVHIFMEKRIYADRLKQLSSSPEKYREGIRFTPDSRYPDLSRDECILHTIMAIAL